MRTTIDAQKFKDIKYAIKHAPTLKQAALNQKVSTETIRKVKNCKTYVDFQELNKSKRQESKKQSATSTAKSQDKRGFWARLFNI